MRRKKSFVSLLITTLAAFVLSLCAGIIFSFNPVTANATWTNDGGVDHYTDMTSNGEDLEYYDTLCNEDWTLYTGGTRMGAMPTEWTLTNDYYITFTPSGNNTTGSFVWKFTYSCTDASGGINVYPLSNGAWNGTGLFDYHNAACGFEADKTYEVDLGVVKVKNNTNYYVFIKVDGVFKVGTYRDVSTRKGNDLYFYITGGAGKAISRYDLEDYQVIQNDDLGLASSYTAPSGDATNGVGFTNDLTTASYVYKFNYTPADSNDAIVYMRSAYWGGGSKLYCFFRGTQIIYQINGVDNVVSELFTMGETSVVELGAIDIKDSDNTWIFVKVDGETVLSQVVDATVAAQTKGVSFYGTSASTFGQYSYDVTFTDVETREVLVGNTIGALPEAPEKTRYDFVKWTCGGVEVTAETIVSSNMTVVAEYKERIGYTDEELEAYVVVQNDDMGMSPSYTVTGGTAHPFTTANATTSMIYKFNYLTTTVEDKDFAIALRTNDWDTNVHFLLRATKLFCFVNGAYVPFTDVFTVNKTHITELGAIDLADGSGTWVFVRVDGEYVYSSISKDCTTETAIFEWGNSGTDISLSQYSYDVTFTDVETREVLVGNTISALPEAPASENEFLGWFDQDGNEVTVETVVVKNLTVTAKYLVTYDVRFIADGETIATITKEENTAIGTLPTAPDKASYVFNGWKDQDGNTVTSATVLTKDLMVTAQYVETETYDILDNADWNLPEEWTTTNDTFLQFTPSAGNTTGSFVWKFVYTAKQTTGGLHVYPLSAAPWRGANPVNLNAISWTADETYKVEFGVVRLKNSSNYSVFINVNGERKYDGTDTIQHNANCTNAGCTADSAHLNGIYFYIDAGSGVIKGEHIEVEYADYVSVQNDDMGMSSSQEAPGGAAFAYAPVASGNNSVVYTYMYSTKTTSTHAVVLQGNNWVANGYAFFITATQITIGAESTGNAKTVSVTYNVRDKIELGAINYADGTKVYLYVKINDVLVGEDTVASRATAAGVFMWNDAVVSQYSWNVTFTGVETREVVAGQAIGDLPTIEHFSNGVWTDVNGNVYTAESVPAADLVLTTDASISYTIEGVNGTDVYSGSLVFGGEPSYDAYNALTKDTTTYIGYLVGDVLYADLTEAIMASVASDEKIVAKTITLGIIDGASIRLNNNPSIRFTATVGVSDSEYAKVLDFGILMTTDEVRKNLSAFTIEGLSGVDSSLYYNYNKNSGNLRYVENEDYANQYVYSLVLDKISKSNYGVKYTARAYVLVEYADGTQAYVYSEFDEETHIRSMYDVASAAIADEETGYTDAQKTIIQKYIDGVIDLNSYLELQGRERNYTVSVSDVDANGDYTVTVTPKNGFDIMGIGAIYVDGMKVSVSNANVSAGTFKISESEMEENVLAVFEYVMAQKEDLRALQISAYSGPSLGVKQTASDTVVAGGYVATYEDLKTYMAAGFDAWYLDVSCLSQVTGYTAKGTTYKGDTPTYDVYRALDLAAQYANETGKPCPVYINIPHLTGMVMDEVEVGKTWIKFIYDIFTNYSDGLTTAANSPVNGINQIGGFMLHDEPALADYDAFAAVYNEIAYTCGAIEAGYGFNCALLQTYAGQELVGSSYADYVNMYATLMRDTRISFDNYPFYYVSKDGWYNSTSENRMEGSWYSDMQAVRANKNGTGACIQSFTAGAEESGWFTKTTKYKYIDKEAEISMQVYTALAYGFTNLDYFVYWDTMNRAMQEANGNTGEIFQQTPIMWNDTSDWSKGHYQTDYYAWIKNSNTEAKSLFEVLSKFTSTGVQLVDGSLACANTFGNASTTNTTNAIAASAAYDMVIGGFTVNGYNGYLAVNVDFPDTDGTRTNAVTFTLGTQYSKAIVYVDGVATVVRVAKDGTLNLNIGCGEGVFIVPIA